jgi:thiol-disulfide isomerase/thioredoxin
LKENNLINRFSNLATTLLAAFLSSAGVVRAAGEAGVTLKPGDPAPPLAVDKWVKGEPVKELEKGKVYVIECWATWCGPCVSAIPHVTELQKKYADKDLVVIGMNVWERDASAVEPFVKKMGGKMDYRVATDEGGQQGTMATTWMKAAGKSGIPCSFIVDRDTKIAWIGHPMQMDRPLAAVIEGKFDPAAEAKTQKKLESAQTELSKALQARDYDAIIKVIDGLVASSDPASARMFKPVKLMALYGKKDYKAGNALAKELAEENAKDQNTLAQLAMMMANQKDTNEVDLDLALSMAENSAKMDGANKPMALSAVAKVHAAKGDYAKAVDAQTKAVDASEGRQKQFLQTQLDEYKKKSAAKVN